MTANFPKTIVTGMNTIFSRLMVNCILKMLWGGTAWETPALSGFAVAA